MAFKATQAQQLAIDTDGGVLVAAAAGSGKTAVLVERVMRKLTDPVSPIDADSLLIVTFTNAAAAEMRSRIEKRISAECRKNPDDMRLLRQKHLIATADICTIDSFCISLVRENFEKCGVSPDFKVSDGSDLQGLKAKALSSILDEQLAAPSEEFRLLLDLCGCEYDEKPLTSLIGEIYDYSLQLPFPEEFIKGLAAPYYSDFAAGQAWYEAAFEAAAELFELAEAELNALRAIAPYTEKASDKCELYADTAAAALEDIKRLYLKRDYDSLSSALSLFSLPRLPVCGSSEASEHFKAAKKGLADALSRLRALFIPKAFIAEQTEYLRPAVSLLCELIIHYSKLLPELLKKENTLTFAHTEQLAFSLLCESVDGSPRLREDMRHIADKYTEVLVDEFQDVNDLQNTLFFVLSGEEQRLFSVGDVKQSIYGFRGSNPKNFLMKKQSYKDIAYADTSDKKKIILSDNFRSRAGVCSFINFFFSLFMAGQGSIVYNGEEQLNAAADFPESDAPAAELLICSPDEDNSDSLLAAEGQCIAQYIKNTLAEGKIIKDENGCLRDARYSDFVILMSAMQNKASVIADELSAFGIPVALSSESFNSSTEILTFTSLLQIIDNPRLDIPLLTVMMSPIFGFSANSVAQIRANHRKDELFCAVTFAAQNGSAESAAFLKRLFEMRSDAALLPPDRLISKLLDSTDYLNIVSAMPGGEARRARLLKLPVLAKQYSDFGFLGLSGFVKYLSTLSEKSLAGSGKENGVRIMSMHASKGLQFPICIAANLSGRINNADSIGRILYKEGLGINFKYFDEKTDSDFRTIGHVLSSIAAHNSTIDERLRLLYVAMTRAEDRLVLVASSKDISASLNKAAGGISSEGMSISRHTLNKSSSMNDWIISAALLHPDGESLRRICDGRVCPISDESSLKISFYKADKAEGPYDAEALEEAPLPELGEAARNIASYRYPYERILPIQAKCSVSAIANKAESEHFAFTARPSFMEKEGLSGAAKGTAIHKIMQFISLEGASDIEDELLRLEDFGYITAAEAAAADRATLKAFFESELFARIQRSTDTRREMRFLTELPASRLDSTLPPSLASTPIIVQGAVDLCFEEGGEIVVLDFKTDRTDSPEPLITAYSEQLRLYSQAVEKIFGKKVKQRLIYSFALSRTIEIL